jgi:hypothetical protein
MLYFRGDSNTLQTFLIIPIGIAASPTSARAQDDMHLKIWVLLMLPNDAIGHKPSIAQQCDVS